MNKSIALAAFMLLGCGELSGGEKVDHISIASGKEGWVVYAGFENENLNYLVIHTWDDAPFFAIEIVSDNPVLIDERLGKTETLLGQSNFYVLIGTEIRRANLKISRNTCEAWLSSFDGRIIADPVVDLYLWLIQNCESNFTFDFDEKQGSSQR